MPRAPGGTVCLDLDSELEGLRFVIAGGFGQYVNAMAPHFPFQDRKRAKSFAGLLLTAIEPTFEVAPTGRASRFERPAHGLPNWRNARAPSKTRVM
jgi:hypothetical protein